MTDSLADHLREHGVRRPPRPVMPVLPPLVRVRSRIMRKHHSPGPVCQIACEVCGHLANRGANARYCSDACKAIARIMRDDTLTYPCEAT